MIHLWMAPLLLAVPATVNPAQAFGRLEHRPAHCRIVVGGRPLACERLQINANGNRGLRLRFIGDDQITGGSYQLSFVSLDRDQGSPLSCDNSGCRLDSRRWNGTLLSTSWVRFDARDSLRAYRQPAPPKVAAGLMRTPSAARVTHATLPA